MSTLASILQFYISQLLAEITPFCNRCGEQYSSIAKMAITLEKRDVAEVAQRCLLEIGYGGDQDLEDYIVVLVLNGKGARDLEILLGKHCS